MLRLEKANSRFTTKPLDQLTITGLEGETVIILDGAGREYLRAATAPEVSFTVAGSLGQHSILDINSAGVEMARRTFQVDASTTIEDGSAFGELFRLLYAGMCVYDPRGVGSVQWDDRTYHYFVPWLLDQLHTQKGMQYFEDCGKDMVDLFRLSQQPDGMIYSFVLQQDPAYFETAYGPFGYFGPRNGDTFFARQPAENHVEYIYVNMLYLSWKASGDDGWMSGTLDAAARALNYSITDGSRFSDRFGLLKRAYTIDSWDFQVEDEHLPDLGIGGNMLIDPDRTRFGVFYGDNTGYAEACDQLAEMMNVAGRHSDAEVYRSRAVDIRRRLDALAWNGRFFTHHIEEDPSVRRDLGVDEACQISLSNAYSINRRLPHEQCTAILRTYEDLRAHLPLGSTGEWYAIYPPFERGFHKNLENEKWQYMNGGVAGHAAGELARGAFEHGFEAYGVDILKRLLQLGSSYGNRIYFAYTGAIPPPPLPHFTPVDLAGAANMDLWDEGAPGVPEWMSAGEPGNDLRELPTGHQSFAGVPFEIVDPDANGRRSAVAISRHAGHLPQVEIPLTRRAKTLYLLHTAGAVGKSGIAAALTLRYKNGSEESVYLASDKHLTGWWFPVLETPVSGVAWRGPSAKSAAVGVCWAAIPNPHPDLPLRSLVLEASSEGAIYALLGLTLSNCDHYIAPKIPSYGGPDNWAAGTAMAALVEGLAGVVDETTVFRQARVAPRWAAAGVDQVGVTIRYAASDGYVSYQYQHEPVAREIRLLLTGSGDAVRCHVPLPDGFMACESVWVDDQEVEFQPSTIVRTAYVDFTLNPTHVRSVMIRY